MCVTYEELVPEIMAYNTLKSLINRRNVEIARRGGGEGSRALIVYNSLPDKYRKRYEEKYGGHPEELYKQKNMKPTFRIDETAKRFYKSFKYGLNGAQTTLDEEFIEQYTVNASVLNELIESFASMRTLEKATNNPRRCLWGIILENCNKLRYRNDEDRLGKRNPIHTLPKNINRLKDTIREYKHPVTDDDGNAWPHNYRSLISGKIGNNNTVKITKESGELLIALMCSRKPVYTEAQIFERYNNIEVPKHNSSVSDKKDMWKPLKSRKSLHEWLYAKENIQKWYAGAMGELAARQKFNVKFNTELAGCRDARWEGDGTRLNLYYRNAEGKKDTCTVYEVMDTYSEALLGYWISDRENYWQQYHAFRMAVQNTRRKPYQIVTDSQGGAKTKRMQDFMKAISHMAHAAMPKNPQSKTIESVLGRFQAQVLRQLYGFTGQNVTSKKDGSRPNLEFVLENVDALPTLEELKKQYAELREMWNGERKMPTTEAILAHHKSGKPRMQMYMESANEFAPEISAEEIAESFWLWTEKPSRFNPDGIEIEVNRQKYKYDVFATDGTDATDVVWRRRNLYRSFWVKFDPNDMSSVKLYWEDKAGGRRFERIASPPVVIHRAIQDQREGEMKTIKGILDLNRQEQVHRFLVAKEIEWKHGVAPEQNGLRTPKLNGFSNEEMAEVNLTLERRTRKYRNKSVMQEYKDVSMMTYDAMQENDETEFNYRRVVEKY
jgi:hypothetical protein